MRLASVGREFFFHVVLTLSLFLSIAFVPLAGFLSGILTPSPTVLSSLRWKPQTALLVPIISGVLGAVGLVLMDMLQSVPYFVALLGMGIVMGHGIRNMWSAEKVVGLSSLVLIAIAGFLLALGYIESKGEMIRLLETDLQNAVSSALKQFGTQSVETQALESALLASVPIIVRILPGILVSSALGVSWINLLVARRYCRAAAVDFCLQEKLTYWKAPELLVWFAIAGGIMVLLPDGRLTFPGMNLLIVLGSIYFLQGIAIAAFYFDKWKMPAFARALIYAVLILQQFASMATAAVGLFDMWFDFRRIKKPA